MNDPVFSSNFAWHFMNLIVNFDKIVSLLTWDSIQGDTRSLKWVQSSFNLGVHELFRGFPTSTNLALGDKYSYNPSPSYLVLPIYGKIS